MMRLRSCLNPGRFEVEINNFPTALDNIHISTQVKGDIASAGLD